MATDVEATTAGTPVKSLPQKRQFQAVFPAVITATVTLTESSIAAAKASQTTFSVPGAALGDMVLISSMTNTVYVLLTAKVSAADTISVSLLNQDSTDASTTFSAGLVCHVAVLKLNTLDWATN